MVESEPAADDPDPLVDESDPEDDDESGPLVDESEPDVDESEPDVDASEPDVDAPDPEVDASASGVAPVTPAVVEGAVVAEQAKQESEALGQSVPVTQAAPSNISPSAHGIGTPIATSLTQIWKVEQSIESTTPPLVMPAQLKVSAEGSHGSKQASVASLKDWPASHSASVGLVSVASWHSQYLLQLEESLKNPVSVHANGSGVVAFSVVGATVVVGAVPHWGTCPSR